MICAAAQIEEIEIYNPPTLKATKMIQQLQEDVKQHYYNDRVGVVRGNKYLLSKENIESDASDKEKANAIRNIKRAKRCNQCYHNLNFS